MSDLMERLKCRWVRDGLTLRPGASPEALDKFESRFGVTLPPAVRDYFGSVDGMAEDLDNDWDWDRDSNRFWSLSAFVSVREFQSGGQEWPAWTDRWFPFADFLINSHAYAVRLTPDPADGGPVCFWDFGTMRSLVATTFEEFLEKYLARTDQLWGTGVEIDEMDG